MDSTDPSKVTKLYGTVVIDNQKTYVKLDGSDILTPASLTVGADDGNRVIVEIHNHELYVTGNISSPSKTADESDKTYANFTTVDALTARIGSIEATQINVAYLQANYANITALDAATGRITDLESTTVKTETLQANYATITDLNSAKGRITSLESNQITTEYLDAHYANLSQIQSDYAKITDLDSAKARIGALESNQITVAYLQANYVGVTELNATKARVDALESSQITTDYLSANYAKLTDLSAAKGRIDVLEANQINVSYMDAHYANLGLTNIAAGTIQTAMIATGAIQSAQIADNSVTNEKVVNLNANRITAGVLSVERLEIVGSTSSLVYALNNMGQLTSTVVNTIDGDVLTPRSIAADKIVANAITANEIAAETITANKIAVNTITSGQIAAGAITTEELAAGAVTATKIAAHSITANEIDVGNLFAQDITATGTIRGVNIIGSRISQSVANSTWAYNESASYTGTLTSMIDSNGITNSFDFDNATALTYGYLGTKVEMTPFGFGWYQKSSQGYQTLLTCDPTRCMVSMWNAEVTNLTIKSTLTTALPVIITKLGTDYLPHPIGYMACLVNRNGYDGLADKYGTESILRTVGLLPGRSTADADANGGTNSWLGNSTWYFERAYIDNVYIRKTLSVPDLTVTTLHVTTVIATTMRSAVTMDANNGTSLFRLAGMRSDGSYWGLTTPDGDASAWIRTSQSGLIPYQSGDSSAGHCMIGTSTWWFHDSYIVNMSAVNIWATTVNTTNLNVGGYSNGSYHFCTSDLICNSWIRTVGATGWYNETYGGGWMMSDSTYVRIWGSKILSVGYDNASYGGISTSSLISTGWLRTVGACGWYSETYGGGWYMADSTYIRTLGSKALYMENNIDVSSANIRFGGNCQDAFGVYNEASRYCMRFNADGTYLRCYNWNDIYKSGITVVDNAYYLGSGGSRFKAVYAATGTIQTSDRNYKDDIQELTPQHLKFFRKLMASSFLYKDGTSHRRHIGYIAQDVERAMEEVGLTSLDFAGLCKDIKMNTIVNTDGTEIEIPILGNDGKPVYIYSLRYDEFSGLQTMAIQTVMNDLDRYKLQNDKRNKLNDQQMNHLQSLVYSLQFTVQNLEMTIEKLTNQAVA